MRDRIITSFLTSLFLIGVIFAQTKKQSSTLVVNGHAADAAVVQINGRDYVDLQTLARLTNGSVAYRGNQVVLTFPDESSSVSTSTPVSDQPTDSSFSPDFMKAGIEEIALMREWASPLAYAIQNGYPITEQWVSGYRDQAAHGLRLASVAAKTGADRNALQLLTNEFEAVRDWSNKLVEARKTMDTARYAMSETALKEDPLSQKIVTCGRFLGPMLGSGSYQDDPSCH